MSSGPAHDFVFYAPDLTTESTQIVLEGEEHRHASRVVRMRAGDSLCATNGCGLMVRASIDSIDRRQAILHVTDVLAARERGTLRMAVAVLKQEAFGNVVRQATEVGVSRFTPFVAANSHLRAYSSNYLARLQRIALSSMKQSFRAVLPRIDSPLAFDTLLADLAEAGPVAVADMGGSAAVVEQGDCTGVVGPEAGLTAGELGALRDIGCRFVRLSPHRLRADTAAVVLASALNRPSEA